MEVIQYVLQVSLPNPRKYSKLIATIVRLKQAFNLLSMATVFSINKYILFNINFDKILHLSLFKYQSITTEKTL